MPIELKIPEVGESITEVQIAEWLKAEGDTVKKDENVAVIDSEKTTFELPSPETGTLVPKQAHLGLAIVHPAIFQILAAKISSLVISTCSIRRRFNSAWRFSIGMTVSNHFFALRKDTASVVDDL